MTGDRNRRLYIYATDGMTTKQTTFYHKAVPYDGTILWIACEVHLSVVASSTIDSFLVITIVNLSSQLTLNIFEELERGILDDKLLSTFAASMRGYAYLENGLFLSVFYLFATNSSSVEFSIHEAKEKSPTREI